MSFNFVLVDYRQVISPHEKRHIRAARREKLQKLYDQRPTNADVYNAAMEPGGDSDNDN